MRNKYPGTCYKCGRHVPVGFGFFERVDYKKNNGSRWRIQCVKCCDGRDVKESDPEVARVRKAVEQ